MTKLLEEAINRLRRLPEDMKDAAARALIMQLEEEPEPGDLEDVAARFIEALRELPADGAEAFGGRTAGEWLDWARGSVRKPTRCAGRRARCGAILSRSTPGTIGNETGRSQPA